MAYNEIHSYIYEYISTYRSTFSVSATRESKDQIGVAIAPLHKYSKPVGATAPGIIPTVIPFLPLVFITWAPTPVENVRYMELFTSLMHVLASWEITTLQTFTFRLIFHSPSPQSHRRVHFF